MPYLVPRSSRQRHFSGNASLRTLTTSVRETAAFSTAVSVNSRIASTILKATYCQPFARTFRDRFFRRRLKGTLSVSSSTPTVSRAGKRHTASMLLVGEELSLPTRNATFSFGLSMSRPANGGTLTAPPPDGRDSAARLRQWQPGRCFVSRL